jgi:segregation and condensation protein A
MVVRELELDLDAFEGPFDLLLTLVLKEELELADVDVAGIVLAFVERLAERDELDLDACGEFLVLVAALLELKARALFPEEDAELAELEPEEAAEELARRLAEYRRMKEAAAWLSERLAQERDRFFRLGPAPLQPRPELRLAPQDPQKLAAALRALAAEPPAVSVAHMGLRFPPVSQFVERFRAVLRRRRRFDFDQEVEGLSRVEQSVAFLALLDLRKRGEIAIEQAAPFAPIRASLAMPASRAGGPAGGPSAPPADTRGSAAAAGRASLAMPASRAGGSAGGPSAPPADTPGSAGRGVRTSRVDEEGGRAWNVRSA